eukprot:CAMPEP_0198206428 /NCGR_PEP_ID=MMETSP1445-20131203/9977_1 /TAXON_ID=36898 /ORGANISM="Pyramimonas sp., Strain CCMP2087" /LENGTH=150 /DNA_ID=CAMNT_0043879119 /DNA_START=192 /DNA_END=641 /DNA_ORIENTATION=-
MGASNQLRWSPRPPRHLVASRMVLAIAALLVPGLLPQSFSAEGRILPDKHDQMPVISRRSLLQNPVDLSSYKASVAPAYHPYIPGQHAAPGPGHADGVEPTAESVDTVEEVSSPTPLRGSGLSTATGAVLITGAKDVPQTKIIEGTFYKV